MHQMRHKHTSRHGFTLAELLIVIALISIITSIAIPAFLSWLPNIRINSSSRDLYGVFTRARTEAARRGKNCYVVFNQTINGKNNVYVAYIDNNSNRKFDAGTDTTISVLADWPAQVLFDATKGGGDGLTFAANDDGLPQVGFSPNMLPTNFGTAFLKNSKETQKSIVVNITGNISIK